MQFSKAQQEAIQDRSGYLLVSAAAGAGKTAVLVERILGMLIHDKISLEEVLVLTFTNAAAAELKDRISRKLLDEVKNHPELMEQYYLVGRAKIGTMHSFCKDLIRKEFHVVGVDPSVGIASGAFKERLYLRAQRRAMETAYLLEDARIQSLVYSYKEEEIIALINELYHGIMSFPKSLSWLKKHVGLTEDMQDSEEDVFRSTFVLYQSILEIEKESLLENLADYIGDPSYYPEKIESLVLGDKELLEQALAGENPIQIKEKLNTISWARFPILKDSQEKVIAAEVKEKREALKEAVKNYSRLFSPLLSFAEDNERQRMHLQALCQIVLLQEQYFTEEKREKNLIDFHDMEHMALAILESEGMGEKIRGLYKAIFIDECQDNSAIQEAILHSLKAEDNTVFMVGDVKQSIYRFRNAEPKLFIDKLKNYAYEKGKSHRKILLNQNFRSNPFVIDACNRVFDSILREDATELSYEIEEDWLHAGRNDTKGVKVRLKGIYGREKENEYALQAAFIAKQIAALVGTKLGEATLDYKDFAILCPKLKNVDNLVTEALAKEGIPFYSDVVSATSNHMETEQLIAWLTLLCNSYDDLALLAVLRGPAFGLSDELLAQIRLQHPDKDVRFSEALYHCASLYEPYGKTEREGYENLLDTASEVDWDSWNAHNTLFTFREIKAKMRGSVENLGRAEGISDAEFSLYRLCNDIRRILSQERFLMRQVTLDIYLWSLVVRTGMKEHFGGQSNGEELMNNIRSFCIKAKHYIEDTGKHIEDFIQDCRLTKAMGESTVPVLLSPYDNLVRIMTIHKSKGLEFPVVFVMGLHASLLSKMDKEAELVKHKDWGLAMCYRNPDLQVKHKTASFEAINYINQQELIAEKARLLYVAMTRAREVLYILDTGKALPNVSSSCTVEDIRKAKRYADWIYLSLREGEDFRNALAEARDSWECLVDASLDLQDIPIKSQDRDFFPWDIQFAEATDLSTLLEEDKATEQSSLSNAQIDALYDKLIHMPVKQIYTVEKDHFEDTRITQKGKRIPEKYSVSQLCDILLKAGRYKVQLPISDYPVILPPPHEIPDYKPPSILPSLEAIQNYGKEKVQSAAEIGTLTHFLLEHTPLDIVRKFLGGMGVQQTYTRMLQDFLWQEGDVHHTAVLDDTTIAQFRKELAEKNIQSPALQSLYEEVLHQAKKREHPQRWGSQADFSNVDMYSICDFFLSDIGIRMLNSHLVYKEHAFTIQLTGWKVLLLTGHIDLCFLEGEEWVLVDFKTDRFQNDEIDEKYYYQIAMYKLALDSLTPFRVKDCYIYSLKKRKAIRV